MNEELDYAEMLEIPVNTVNVVKKKSIFKRKGGKESKQEDLKEAVLESVNERVGASVYSEDLSDPPKPSKRHGKNAAAIKQNVNGSKVVFIEAVAVALIAIAIFVTNLLVPNTVINTFLNSFSASTEEEKAYSEFTLTSIVGDFSDIEVGQTSDGVLFFTAEGCVYPVCEGKVKDVSQTNGAYTLEVAHTSTFKSVITGLTDVYSAVGTEVRSNIPVGYSNGEREVRVSLYDNDELLTCFSLSGDVPVWNS